MDANFYREHWFNLGWLCQLGPQYQELSKELVRIRDKVHSRIERMEYEVKFLKEYGVIREASVVTIEVKHLMRGLVCIDDVNAYRTGSHVEHMMKLHA